MTAINQMREESSSDTSQKKALQRERAPAGTGAVLGPVLILVPCPSVPAPLRAGAGTGSLPQPCSLLLVPAPSWFQCWAGGAYTGTTAVPPLLLHW